MANSVYNTTDIETTITNAGKISTNLTTLTDDVVEKLGNIDIRVYEYFDCFEAAKTSNTALSGDISTVDSFKTWMTEAYSDFTATKTHVDGMSGTGIPDLTLSEQFEQFPSINVDPSKTTPYDLTAEAWEALSTEDKKAIEAKLKELGFTDEEIQAIKDGNASVNRTTLNKLNSALEKLNNEGSDVRQVILEQYGFDVFNDDGTVNQDKLALALLIDGKNPNDEYDLVNLLKTKYGIDLFPPEASIPTTPSVPGDVNPTLPTEPTTPPTTEEGTTPTGVHTGVSYGGDGIGNGFGSGADIDTSEIQNMLDGTEDDSLLDGIGSLSGSVLGGKNGFDIGFNDKDAKGSGAGLATGAGLAGLGMAATVGLLAKKKREQELVDGEDDDDFDDDYDEDDLDSDSLLGSAVNGKNSYDEDDDDYDDQDKFSVTRKKKDWLYGLGIGLAGAGLAAGLIAKYYYDYEEDEEDDD
ncbi:MAG: hypothetical protein IJ463_01700 [Bacilli bacterium]|nr:hypothetical protein [Bacilli bacterium]